MKPVPGIPAAWNWLLIDRPKQRGGLWRLVCSLRRPLLQGAPFPPPTPEPPRASPARMLSAWLTAASTRLRGRSQKKPEGSKGAWVDGGWGVVVLVWPGVAP